MSIQEDITRRTTKRTRVLLTGTVISSAGSKTVRIRDLSAVGAQVYAEDVLSGDVCFKREKLFVAARVAWRRRGVAGLEFYRELTPLEVEEAFPLPA